jgi:CRP-like cAMP-binding protein
LSAGRSLFANAKETIELRQGETLFRERDEGTRMFGVIDGSIELLRDGHLVTTIGPGEMFGELALIDNSPRSLQARAATDCALAAIDRRIGYGAHGQSCDA